MFGGSRLEADGGVRGVCGSRDLPRTARAKDLGATIGPGPLDQILCLASGRLGFMSKRTPEIRAAKGPFGSGDSRPQTGVSRKPSCKRPLETMSLRLLTKPPSGHGFCKSPAVSIPLGSRPSRRCWCSWYRPRSASRVAPLPPQQGPKTGGS